MDQGRTRLDTKSHVTCQTLGYFTTPSGENVPIKCASWNEWQKNWHWITRPLQFECQIGLCVDITLLLKGIWKYFWEWYSYRLNMVPRTKVTLTWNSYGNMVKGKNLNIVANTKNQTVTLRWTKQNISVRALAFKQPLTRKCFDYHLI